MKKGIKPTIGTIIAIFAVEGIVLTFYDEDGDGDLQPHILIEYHGDIIENNTDTARYLIGGHITPPIPPIEVREATDKEKEYFILKAREFIYKEYNTFIIVRRLDNGRWETSSFKNNFPNSVLHVFGNTKDESFFNAFKKIAGLK